MSKTDATLGQALGEVRRLQHARTKCYAQLILEGHLTREIANKQYNHMQGVLNILEVMDPSEWNMYLSRYESRKKGKKKAPEGGLFPATAKK